MARYGTTFAAVLALFAWFVAFSCQAENLATADEAFSSTKCDGERYDDFFKQLHDREKSDEDRERFASEVKEQRRQHAEQMEHARREYVKTRVPHREDPRLEHEWEEEVKTAKKREEEMRRKYVEAKLRAEKLCHARKIPEMKEYDLEE